MIKNLWKETLDYLEMYGKTFDDVLFVCGDAFEVTKENFERVAKETNYDSGFGSQKVACDLKLVGDGWWLERWEYDGSEGWEYNEAISRPKYTQEISYLARDKAGFWWTDIAGLQT